MINLSMHMMDMAQNSIRAKATTIAIGFWEQTCSHILTFWINDNGCGMNAEIAAQVSDPFFTTRTTRSVGMGIPFLKMTSEQTGGNMRIESKEGRGTLIKVTYKTDNVDCPPLGDLAGYFTLLPMANPSISFSFKYMLNDEYFIISSKELKEQNINIQLPQIRKATKDFIAENLKELFKKRPFTSFLC